jgi:hypothetical protein
MKKNLFTVMLAAFVALTIISCTPDKKELLSKKWGISEFKSASSDKMMADLKAKVESTTESDSVKNMAKMQLEMFEKQMAAMKDWTMEFKKDGAFETNVGGDTKGTWSLVEIKGGGTGLVIEAGDTKKDTSTVVELAAEKLVIEAGKGDDKVTMTLTPAKAAK